MKMFWARRGVVLSLCALLCGPGGATAQPSTDASLVRDAREAFGKRDRVALATLRQRALEQRHEAAPWIDYWALNNRLGEAQQAELDAFYARWRGTYVEDRLRNDWLLELGRRRDWQNFTRDHADFRMRDDREVACYALLIDHQDGRTVRDAALTHWLAQRDPDDGCALLARSLHADKVFTDADVWLKVRRATETGRTRTARDAAALLGAATAKDVAQALDNPARHLAASKVGLGRTQAEIAALALARMAANDPEVAATQLDERWQRRLPGDLAAWAWAVTGRQAAGKLLPTAHEHFRRAARLAHGHTGHAGIAGWSDDTQAWRARALLRAVHTPQRWELLQHAIASMSPALQRDPTWVYWRARALLGQAAEQPPEAEALRAQAQQLLESIADPLHFYGQLASEDLRREFVLPGAPAPLTDAEREAVRSHAGLARALWMIDVGLRSEGVREWNFSLRGLGERELLAAAQWACEREVWDRCIHASERTRAEIDIAQRYPLPFRTEMTSQASAAGIDPAYVFGLIRQESRFITDARSHVGASGLMQVMPATARWTARKIGLTYSPDMLNRRDVNLRLGTAYLRLVLDDVEGSQAMAAAAYNAGPGRPRRWREGPMLETAIWAENIPFSETRDYVKKVLANATVYAAILGSAPSSLKARLGPGVGPRATVLPPPDEELP